MTRHGRQILLGILWVLCCCPAQAQEKDHAAIDQLDLGNQAFRVGDVLTATQHWSDAIKLCRATGATDLEAQARARRGEAYRLAGYYRDAANDLTMALAESKQVGDQDLIAASGGALGNLKLLLRRSADAEPQLQQSHDLALRLHNWPVLAASANDLGNLFAATDRPAAAERAYAEAVMSAEQAHDMTLAATAEVNAARLALRSSDEPRAAQLLTTAIGQLQNLPPDYANGLALISAGSAVFERSGPVPAALQSLAYRAFHAVADSPETARNPTLASLARGSLGRLYERTGQLGDAAALTQRALFAAQQAAAPELTFRWNWQRARLARLRGNIDDALAGYRAADTALQSVRQDIPVEYREGHSSYRVSFEPFYLQFADLLLHQASAEKAQSQTLLKEARDTIEQLKESELQDYFQDSCVTSFVAKRRSIDTVAPGTAVLYPIVLPDRIEMVVSIGQEEHQFTLPISAAVLRDQVNHFRTLLEKSETNEYLPLAQQLYTEIIRPIDPTLASHNIDTLVIVPDGILRTIPFAALNDGSHFLVERYATAIAPSLHLTDPRPFAATAENALVLGISVSTQGFTALPNVAREVKQVHEIDGGKEFLNDQFTRAVFENQLKRAPFGIVHIASHGEFGTDPSRTFVLAFDGHLTMDDLEQTIKYGELRPDALELLTLDACETATGDDRAALGLAGIALKSGARSALATLWFISDQASGRLVVEFYKALKEGQSKAKALQTAQKAFIANPLYSHPAYWAPFLLIGSWL